MKIAFIFSQFPCYDETFILREMNELKKAGLDFEIYSLKSCKDKIIHREAEALAQKTRTLPFVSLRVLGFNIFFLLRHPIVYLRTFCEAVFGNLASPNFFLKTLVLWPKAVGFAWIARRHRITHAHGQWATYPATAALIMARLNRIPFSFTAHAHDIYQNGTFLAHKIRAARFVVTCTADNKRYLGEISKTDVADKIIVNYHGVDLEKFKREDGSGKREEGRRLKILSVGSLLESKGFEYLIEACGILRDRGIEFECVVAGGGRLEERLKLQAVSRGLKDKIKFTGYIKQEELMPFYKEADIFVLAMVPEKHWGIPNVLIEALACGVPVVCTLLPSIPELVRDGQAGLIISPQDAVAIADAVVRLRTDSELRVRLAEAGRRIVEEKFDMAKNAQRLKNVFAGDGT